MPRTNPPEQPDFSGEVVMTYTDDDDNDTRLIVRWRDNEVQDARDLDGEPYPLTRAQHDYFNDMLDRAIEAFLEGC
jgi:hypothetical protein